MSEGNNSIKLLQNTISQLTIIAKQLEGKSVTNSQVLADVKTLANTTKKLVADLQNIATTEELDTTVEPETITEKKEILKQKKVNFSRFLIPGIIGLVLVVGICIWLFVLPQQPQVEIVEKSPPTEQIEPIEEPGIPAELITPELPQKVKTITPELELTPEQGLIAAIKNQITTIKNRYAEGLVISIEPNFLASSLKVKVSDRWYELGDFDRDSIANDIFKEVQKLDFKKLEIDNIQGKIVARSPVVGDNMIILQTNRLLEFVRQQATGNSL